MRHIEWLDLLPDAEGGRDFVAGGNAEGRSTFPGSFPPQAGGPDSPLSVRQLPCQLSPLDQRRSHSLARAGVAVLGSRGVWGSVISIRRMVDFPICACRSVAGWWGEGSGEGQEGRRAGLPGDARVDRGTCFPGCSDLRLWLQLGQGRLGSRRPERGHPWGQESLSTLCVSEPRRAPGKGHMPARCSVWFRESSGLWGRAGSSDGQSFSPD